MDNILLPRKTCTSLTSILKFKVPPYSNVSCARCRNQLLESDRKLHFERSSEIGGGLPQRVTRSILHGTLFDSFTCIYTEGTFAKFVNLAREGPSSGPLSMEELQSGHTVTKWIIKLSSPEKVYQEQTYTAFLYSLQKCCGPITLRNEQLGRMTFGDCYRWRLITFLNVIS